MTQAAQLAQYGANNVGLSFKNRIINGDMSIFQRGTAATADAQYSVDRWRFVKTNDATESTSQNADAPVGFSFSLRNTISTGDGTIGAGQYSGFEQSIEGFNTADLAWGTANAQAVTLSFWVRSSVTGQYTGSLRNNDSSRRCPFNYTISAANTWEYKTVSVVGDITGTWLTNNGIGITVALYAALGSNFISGSPGVWGGGFGCGTPVNGIASNGNIFAISGVQLEKGTVATSFDYLPYTTELQLCYRYFQKFLGSSAYEALPSYAIAGSGTSVEGFLAYKGTMRSTPTLAISTLCLLDAVNVLPISGASATNNGVDSMRITYSGISGLTQYRSYYVTANNSTSAFLTLSSEL
jgi:hypothetical protein